MNIEQAVARGVDWLRYSEQPEGAVITHLGMRLKAGNWRFSFATTGEYGYPILVVDGQYLDKLDAQGYQIERPTTRVISKVEDALRLMEVTVVDRWNGALPSKSHLNTGSWALYLTPSPSLLAAVRRYQAGCPEHHGSVFCCNWYRAGSLKAVGP